MRFKDRLAAAWEQADSMLCVGLDPDPKRIPQHVMESELPLFDFCRSIVEVTSDLACAYKPQLAHFIGQDALPQLAATIGAIRELAPHTIVILDAKFGDIGSTAEWYAKYCFEHLKADAVTLNPYMGGDSLKPFTEDPAKGAFVLCHTSNNTATELQTVRTNSDRPLFLETAELAERKWNRHENVGLVVGATYPEALARVRESAGAMPLLVPGIGIQGGSVKEVIQYGRDAKGKGLVINASRSILYAGDGIDYTEKSRAVAKELVKVMRETD